jgi:hypothetical protein
MEPVHSETGDCRVEPPASILVARLCMSHLVPLLEFNQCSLTRRFGNFHKLPCTEGESRPIPFKNGLSSPAIIVQSVIVSPDSGSSQFLQSQSRALGDQILRPPEEVYRRQAGDKGRGIVTTHGRRRGSGSVRSRIEPGPERDAPVRAK